MPTYTFRCKNKDCQEDAFEVFMTMADYQPKSKCPSCRRVSKERVYDADVPNGFVKMLDSELKTLDHLGRRNYEKLSDDAKESFAEKHRTKKVKKAKLPKGMSKIQKGPKPIWPA